MHYHFTIKDDEDKGLSVAINEWAFAQPKENLKYNDFCISVNLYQFEKKYEDEESYYEQKKLGQLLLPIPDFEDLGIDEDNYDDFKKHILEYLSTTILLDQN
jgi:hypothetical protein